MPRFINAATVLMTIFACGTTRANNVGGATSICDVAAHSAAREFEIPVDVLLAITRTETGRGGQHGLNPWPWTVNMEGAGHWFVNRADALNFALDHHQNGARSFDIGCFQINFKWHGEYFDSVEDMFDPSLNAQYAARFLTQLHLEFGSWSDAAGAFHSRTPSKAESYAARFDRIRLSVNSDLPKPMPPGNFPLGIFDRRGNLRVAANSTSALVSGGSPKLGSLFPNTRTSAGNIRPTDEQNQGS